MQIIYHDTDMVIEIEGLYDLVNEDYINNAVVTVTLTDENFTPLSGESWPITMAYITSSDGNYRAVLDADIDTALIEDGYALISIDAGAGRTSEVREPVTFVTRGGTVPDKSQVTITCYGDDTEPAAGVEIWVQQLEIPTGDQNRTFDGNLIKYTSDANGRITLVLWRNSKYRYRRGNSMDFIEFTPDAGNFSVTSIVG